MYNLQNILNAINNRFFLKADRGPIGVGLIGVGGWGASNAASVMHSRRFNIIGVYDIRRDVAAKFSGRFSTKCYSHIDELLAESDIQAACITVPNPFHGDMVKAVAAAGKHIFIEKPLASHPDECRALGEYCKSRDVILQVGHQMRRNPVFREIKRILDNGDLGRPLFAQGVNALDRRSRDDWRRDASACPGGSMEQLGVHLIDALIYLFGIPVGSQGWMANIPPQTDGPDWRHVSMSFNKNIHAVISTSFSSLTHMQLEFYFAGGRLVTDGQTVRISRGGMHTKVVRPRGTPGSVMQFVEFADCIEKRIAPETGAMEAAWVMDVVQSIFARPREQPS
jgi:predicted dehydrogenase